MRVITLATFFFLADGTAAPGTWYEPLIQMGGIGVVLLWFMFKTEPRLRGMEAAIDRLSRAVLLLVISIPHANDAAKEQAQGIIGEIDAASKTRGD